MADPIEKSMTEDEYQQFSNDPRPDNVKAAELVDKDPSEVQGYRAESDPDHQGKMKICVYLTGDPMPMVSSQAGENVRGESGLGIGRDPLLAGVPVPAETAGAPAPGESVPKAPAPGDTSPEVATDSNPMATPQTSQPRGMTPEPPAEDEDDEEKGTRGRRGRGKDKD